MPRTATNGQGCPQIAFTCGNCNTDHGDPLYTGPTGHAPPLICADCWAEAWELRDGDPWSPQIEALYGIACGDTFTAAAKRAGVHRNTLLRWRNAWRNNPSILPQAVRQILDVDAILARRKAG